MINAMIFVSMFCLSLLAWNSYYDAQIVNNVTAEQREAIFLFVCLQAKVQVIAYGD